MNITNCNYVVHRQLQRACQLLKELKGPAESIKVFGHMTAFLSVRELMQVDLFGHLIKKKD